MQRKSISQLRVRKQNRSGYYDGNVGEDSKLGIDYHYDKSGNGFNLSGFERGNMIVRTHDDSQDSYVDNKAMRFD